MAVPTNPDHSSTTGDPYQSFSPRQKRLDSEGRTWSEMQPTGLPLDGLLPVTPTESEASLAGRVVLLPKAIEGPGVIFKEVIPESVIQRTVTLEDRLEAVLSKKSAPLLVENQKLLLLFFKKHKFSPEAIERALIKLAELTPDSLTALLKELARPSSALWGFVNFSIKSLQQGTEAEIQTKIQEFFGSSITTCDFSEICRVAMALYDIESSIPKESSSASEATLKLTHTSQGLVAVRGDQARYQEQFMETVQEACKKIDKEPFDEVLKYVANRRREMAKPSCEEADEKNSFGVRRRNPNDHFHTKMVGPYEQYRDLFFKSDKQGWKFDSERLLYQLELVPEGKKTPIRLTAIEMDVDRNFIYGTRPVTVWYHTPQENIVDVLKEAERIFKELPDPTTVAHTDAGLENVMEAVGKLHWWLAQACPYERGSAAIAKMMACAVLRHYGIEAGGFGSVEPDCMALIQHPDQFIENYSKLMVFPPPHWIEK